jgi:hypothetical protein
MKYSLFSIRDSIQDMFWITRASQLSMHLPLPTITPYKLECTAYRTSHGANEAASVSVPRWKDAKVPIELGQTELQNRQQPCGVTDDPINIETKSF